MEFCFCSDLDAFVDESGIECGSDEIAHIACVIGEAKHLIWGDALGIKAIDIWLDV